MKVVLIALAALVVLVLVWAVVLPQLGMGAQWAAWRAYRRKHDGAGQPIAPVLCKKCGVSMALHAWLLNGAVRCPKDGEPTDDGKGGGT